MSEPAAPPSLLSRLRRSSLLLYAIILLSGVIIGASGTALLMEDRGEHRRPPFMGDSRRREMLTEHLRETLQLDEQQVQELQVILDRYKAAMDAIRSEMIPRLRAETDRLSADIATILTPEQAARWEGEFESFRNRFFPRDPRRHGHGGRPGGADKCNSPPPPPTGDSGSEPSGANPPPPPPTDSPEA